MVEYKVGTSEKKRLSVFLRMDSTGHVTGMMLETGATHVLHVLLENL